MKRLLISLGSAAIAFHVLAMSGPSGKTDRERAELRGSVQSVSSRWEANHKDEYGSVEDRELGTFTYDEAGNLLVEKDITPDFIRNKVPERHGPNETLFRATLGSSVERYKFDASGNLIETQTWYGERADGTPAMTERYRYDAAGRVIERDFLEGDGTGKRFDVRVFTRDSAGNVTLEEIRPADQKPPYPRMHYTYTFDSHGNWLSKIVKRENVPEDSYDYRYAGNVFRTITYFGGGS